MEVLPSLARAAIARSFDPAIWPDGTCARGVDITIGGRSCSELVDETVDSASPSRILVTEVRRLVRSGPLVLCDVNAHLPQRGADLADAAWPGAHLAGARMRQLLVRGADGSRLAGVVEVPADVPIDAVIALAITITAQPEEISSACVQCDDSDVDGRWINTDPFDRRRNSDIYRRSAG